MKQSLLLLLLIIAHQWVNAQSIGIGTAAPDSSAILEINSSSKGLLLPRIKDTSAIKNPARGLLVFNNNDNRPWYYDGSQWQKTGPGEVNASAAPGPGMDSLWYKVQDSIAYSYYPYVHINTNLSLIEPQATLQVSGSLLLQGKLNHSSATPTPAQTYTMNNTAIEQTIPAADSVFRIYDPGGVANYNNNMQGNIYVVQAYKQVGIKISSVAADFGLGTGDTLWIAYDVFPACRTNYAYRFANTTVNPADFIVGAYDGANVYFIFRSNADGTNGKGFSFLATRLFNSEKYKKIQAAGPALYFNSTNGGFAAGYNADVFSTNGTALGSFTKASGTNATAIGFFTKASGSYATAMGYATSASANYATVTGYYTTASGQYSTAMGNNAKASGHSSTVTGAFTTATGHSSTAMGNHTTADGDHSTATGKFSSAPGYASTAMGDSSKASGLVSFAGGFRATAGGNYSVAIGNTATANGNYSASMGYNVTSSGNYSTAIGNYVTASGVNATAIGSSNTASGSYSTALGNFVNTNGYTGSFLIGDLSTIAVMNGTSANNFRARFAGGYRFYTSSDYSTSCALSPGANAWSTSSDVRLKENFSTVNGEEFLQKIAGMRLVSWNYKKQDPAQYRHYGPMAQDFYAAFGKDRYGNIGNDTTINSADFDGVNMIAIQALEKRTTLQQEQIEQLNNIIIQLRKELDELKKNNE